MQGSDNFKIIKLNWVRMSGTKGKTEFKQIKNNINELRRIIISLMTFLFEILTFNVLFFQI